jgi:hypothetical protein
MASLFVIAFLNTTDRARITIVYPMLLLLLTAYFVRKGNLAVCQRLIGRVAAPVNLGQFFLLVMQSTDTFFEEAFSDSHAR